MGVHALRSGCTDNISGWGEEEVSWHWVGLGHGCRQNLSVLLGCPLPGLLARKTGIFLGLFLSASVGSSVFQAPPATTLENVEHKKKSQGTYCPVVPQS